VTYSTYELNLTANLMSLYPGSARDAPGGSRKAGSAHLVQMHQPVPPGGSVLEVLRNVNNCAEAASRRPGAAPAAKKRWMGITADDAQQRPVAPAWNPGGRAREGAPARGADVVARGPHLAFRRDYYKQEPENYVKPEKVGVRPYRGVDGVRPEQQPVWEMKQPQKPGPWQPAYPKCHAQNGPEGPFPQGRERLGADLVGPIVEFKQRRVDLRPHAQGHGKVDAHRISVFPSWPLPAQHDEEYCILNPDRERTLPADPEDRSRAAAPVLNARRSAAVRRVFMALDPYATGKIEIRELLSHMRPQAFRKRLDFFGRDGVLVSPDDLDEQLSGMLTSLLQKQSKDVRLRAAFMPSGTASGCRAGRMGNLTGMVSLLELQDVYAALGCHIHDDGYFEEILQNTWEFKEPQKDVGRVRNGRLEYLDVNGNMR
jgi:hypothetical protein